MRSAWETSSAEIGHWWIHLHDSGRLPALIAAWLILLTLVAIVVLLVSILYLNLHAKIRNRREERWRAQWLLQLLDPEGEGKDLKIRRNQLFPFLEVWTHFQESVKGGLKDSLSSLAIRAGIAELCMQEILRGGIREQIWAATTLGHLRHTPSWDVLVEVTRSKDSAVSLSAIRALARIDAARTAQDFLEDFIRREEWPLNSVYAILLEMNSDVLTEPLVIRLLGSVEQPPLRAIQFLGAIRNEASMVVVQTLLHRPQPWASQVALLKSVHDPELGSFVRSRLESDEWQVVAAAVNALSRIGSRDDLPRLLPLLTHPEWWVRYRTAHTMVRLPGVKPIEIEIHARRITDTSARDMLHHALAIRNLG